MADKKLNEVSQLTDFDYALVVKGNDVAKVTKAQLASIVGELIGVVTANKDGLMSRNGFISRINLTIPSGGFISDVMTSDMKDGIYQVIGISALDPIKDWGVLFVVGSKFALFKPLNRIEYLITITRPSTTSEWDVPYQFTGNKV